MIPAQVDVAVIGGGQTGLAQAHLDVALELGRRVEPAVALGEVHPGEAEVVLAAAHEGRVVVAGIHLGEELVEAFGDERCRFGHGRRS